MRQSPSLVVMLALVVCGSAAVNAQPGAATGPWQTYDTSEGEWRSYAGSIGGQKYSPLDQIDAGNFADLEIAWEWLSVDRRISLSTPGGGEWSAPLNTVVDALVEETPDLFRTGHRPILSRLQATPLMVDGVLYFNTPLSQGVAVDATTGETLLGVQPEGLRRGHADDEQPVVAAGRRLLDRRRGGRADLLGHRQRLPGLRRRAKTGRPVSGASARTAAAWST